MDAEAARAEGQEDKGGGSQDIGISSVSTYLSNHIESPIFHLIMDDKAYY